MKVELTVLNPNWKNRKAYVKPIAETYKFVGELLSPEGAAKVRLSVEGRGEFTERVIDRERVLSCKAYCEPEPKPAYRFMWDMDNYNKWVDGPDTVARIFGYWSCSCFPFFKYRKCQHITQMKEICHDES
jgi:hypothetical protein